jgi:hypothetical protein
MATTVRSRHRARLPRHHRLTPEYGRARQGPGRIPRRVRTAAHANRRSAPANRGTQITAICACRLVAVHRHGPPGPLYGTRAGANSARHQVGGQVATDNVPAHEAMPPRSGRNPGKGTRGRRLRAASAVCCRPSPGGGSCPAGPAGAGRWDASPPAPGGSPCADDRPARLSSQSCNSTSQPVGTAIAKTNQTTMTGTAKSDPSAVNIITGQMPMNAAVAQAIAATAFLFTDSRAGSGSRALVGQAGMSAVRAVRSA